MTRQSYQIVYLNFIYGANDIQLEDIIKTKGGYPFCQVEGECCKYKKYNRQHLFWRTKTYEQTSRPISHTLRLTRSWCRLTKKTLPACSIEPYYDRQVLLQARLAESALFSAPFPSLRHIYIFRTKREMGQKLRQSSLGEK